MDDETRQPRSTEDYMNMIVTALKVNTPQDAWQAVEELRSRNSLVWLTGDNRLAFAGGVRVGAWQQIADGIKAMINETVVG